MEIIRKELKLCLHCMEEHEVHHVKLQESNIFKGVEVEYDAVYEYCGNSGEFWASEEYSTLNDIAMKDAYRRKLDLLTSQEIVAIRSKYKLSQSDLALLLDWGGKTITRYEGHQVQDAAHDAILKKIDTDPEWLLSLLEEKRSSFSESEYQKCHNAVSEAFVKNQDMYLRKAIYANYVKIDGSESFCGGVKLNLDKVIEVIKYFANSILVKNLYTVKLMKLLWYSDALSYKRHGHSITGLAYCSMPRGAVPLSYKSIIDLDGISYEEVDFGDHTGYKFIGEDTPTTVTTLLSSEDKQVINDIIGMFGASTMDEIVARMHDEQAYKVTPANDLIRYEHARALSIN